ncbi:iron-regulated outer membrane protein [Helicobacter pylori]|nr:iron-regulated outer membrane protein [Helicobacter pylori]
MNDKRFRKYWSFSLFLSLLGMFELEAKEEEKEERKTERKKDKKKNAQHTLGKVTTQAAKIFNYNNQTTISSKELERRQANQISDMFRRNPNINVGGGAVIAQKIYVRGIEDRLARVTVDGAAQMGQAMGIKAIRLLTLECSKAWWLLRGRLKRARGLWL